MGLYIEQKAIHMSWSLALADHLQRKSNPGKLREDGV